MEYFALPTQPGQLLVQLGDDREQGLGIVADTGHGRDSLGPLQFGPEEPSGVIALGGGGLRSRTGPPGLVTRLCRVPLCGLGSPLPALGLFFESRCVLTRTNKS